MVREDCSTAMPAIKDVSGRSRHGTLHNGASPKWPAVHADQSRESISTAYYPSRCPAPVVGTLRSYYID